MYCNGLFTFAKKIPLRFLFSFAVLLFLVISCKQIDVYEKTVSFKKHEWNASEQPSFSFDIIDTVSRYNVFVVLRHTDAYHYNNMWLNLSIIPPGDTVQTIRANLKLGDNKQWLGNSIDDIIEHRILINSNPIRFKKGNYKFVIQQIMRENPLPDVLNAGVRVEKTN